jgi:hypothetical protein
MPLVTGERALHKTQIGVEITHGTGVSPTVILDAESGAIIDLDRSPASPDLDFSSLAREQPGYGSFGVRHATMPEKGVVTFNTIMYRLRHGIAGSVTPTGAGPYVWVYGADNSSDTVQSATIEEGDTIQAYRMTFGLVSNYHFFFSDLAAPGNSPWNFECTWMGADKQPVTFAGGASALASSGYAMGHLTRAYIGSTATAFASLSEQVSLLATDLVVPTGIVARKWGGITDTMDAHGRMKRAPTGTATFFQTAATKTGIFDVFNNAGAQMVEKRLRISAPGTGTDVFIIDGRIRLTAVPIHEANGATVYAGALQYVYDATLGTDIVFSVTNSVASLV